MTDTIRDISQSDIEKVFSTIDIPTCPAMVVQVMAEAQKEEPDIRKLAKSIASDVGMAAIAIKLANSPLFRTGKPVSDIPKALTALGIRNVVSIVVTVALRASMSGLPSNLVEKFWKRTTSISMAAGLIARKQYGISPDAAYTYALFHDAAIPLMMRRFPNYVQVLKECEANGRLLIEAESEYFPCTHPIVGSLLVRNWGLPGIVGTAIRFHHDSDLYNLPDKTIPGGAVSLIAVTQVAEHLSAESHGEKDLYAGNEHFQRAVAHLGISESELADLQESLIAAMAEAEH